MAMRIKDYALIGNIRTAALVGRDGSIDWLCAPRFDAPACFAALLGTSDHGRWLLAPRGPCAACSAATATDAGARDRLPHRGGTVRVVDFMPPWEDRTDIVRIVEGLRGRVRMRMELTIRFGYGVDRAVGSARRRRPARHRRTGHASFARRAGARQGIHHAWRLHGRAGGARCLRPHALRLAPAAPAAARRRMRRSRRPRSAGAHGATDAVTTGAGTTPSCVR